jgi:hypothetical protein
MIVRYEGCYVSTVENTAPSPGSTIGNGSRSRGWQAIPVTAGLRYYAKAQVLLWDFCTRISNRWTSLIVRGVLGYPTRTALYVPVHTVVMQRSAGDASVLPSAHRNPKRAGCPSNS